MIGLAQCVPPTSLMPHVQVTLRDSSLEVDHVVSALPATGEMSAEVVVGLRCGRGHPTDLLPACSPSAQPTAAC